MEIAKIHASGQIKVYKVNNQPNTSGLLRSAPKQRTYRLKKTMIKDAAAVQNHKYKRVYIVALTYPYIETDIKRSNRILSTYLKNLIQNYKLKSYVGVLEEQKNGSIHYHFLMTFDKYLIDIQKINKAWLKAIYTVTGNEYRSKNSVRFGTYYKGRRKIYVTSSKEAVLYMIKYMSKNKNGYESKCYYITQNLLKYTSCTLDVASDTVQSIINKSYVMFCTDYVCIYISDTEDTLKIVISEIDKLFV